MVKALSIQMEILADLGVVFGTYCLNDCVKTDPDPAIKSRPVLQILKQLRNKMWKK